MTDREFSALIVFIGVGLTLVGTAYALLPLQAIGSRHNYPPLPRTGIRFDHIRDDGLMVRYEPCRDCGCAKQEQQWEPYVVRQGNRPTTRLRYLGARTVYQENEQGETYVATGHGRIVSRAFREAIATQGMDEEAESWAKDALRVARKAARAQVAKQAEREP